MFGEQKSWEQIEESLKQRYGAIGEETYLRVRTKGVLQSTNEQELGTIGKRYLENMAATSLQRKIRPYSRGCPKIRFFLFK